MSRGAVATVWITLAATGATGCGRASETLDAPPPPPIDAPPPPIDAPPADAPIDGPPGVPDLRLVDERMTDSWIVNTVAFEPDDCAVIEGCVGAPGLRTLLRFTTVSANRGTGDLVLGMPPPATESNDVFQWSACHQHHHFAGYTSYELVSDTGEAIRGRKQSFCLQDNDPVQIGAPKRGFSCLNQGLSSGWADVYSRTLACQWIDITGLAPGSYTLRVTVNPDRTLTESNYDNNTFTVDVRF